MEQHNQTGALKTEESLLTPEFLRKIEQLSLVSRRLFSGKMRGERRSFRRGASVEFADYRNYSQGDDFRRVDWNVYARLEKLFLKLFVEEEDLQVYILLDSSESMAFGSPSKLLYAKRIAASLAYIALCGFDQVSIHSLQDGISSNMRAKRGKQSAFALFDFLGKISAAGKTSLANSTKNFCQKTARPGLAILISDFLDSNYLVSISALVSRKFDVLMLQVLDEQEVDPSLVGDLMLVDCETAQKREVTITQALQRRYKERFKQFTNNLQQMAARYGCSYVQVTNATPFEDLILGYLRQRSALK